MPPLPDLTDLPLARQVAQMVVVRASGHLFDHQIRYPLWEPPAETLRRWIADLGVGGVILLGGSAAEVGLRSYQLQSWADISLLMAADIEEGVGQRFAGATWFPPPMAIAHVASSDRDKAIQYATQMGEATAQEALAIGLNWVLAPVVDVNNNPTNPVINVRAFGDRPDIVRQLTTAFIQGIHRYPVLTAAKHFPGHGDTDTDSHLELPIIPHPIERLKTVELPPFEAAIAAGVDAVMSAHLLIPALDADHPATLSPSILTGLLRHTLGFEGLAVTDALVMGAIANHYGKNEAAVMAVEAGADILLMPLDPEGAIHAVCAAVEAGRLPASRIRASVERIERAKQRIASAQLDQGGSSHAWENVPPPPVQLQQLAQPQTRAIATAILRDSMIVHLTQPLRPVNRGRNIIVIDDSLDCDFLGHHTPAIARPKEKGYRTLQLIDTYTTGFPAAAQSALTEPTLLQLFVRGNPFRGSAVLSESIQTWIDAIAQDEYLGAVLVYGSPYIFEQLQSQLLPSTPLIFTFGQMPLAQTIALDALFQPPEANV